MEISEYQRAARETSQLRLGGPHSAVAPMLGLASATGAILNVYKKYLRGGIVFITNREFLHEELGDLLWYLAAVATACDLGHPTQGTSTAPRRDGGRKHTVAQIAEFGVARPTIYRHLAEAAV